MHDSIQVPARYIMITLIYPAQHDDTTEHYSVQRSHVKLQVTIARL